MAIVESGTQLPQEWHGRYGPPPRHYRAPWHRGKNKSMFQSELPDPRLEHDSCDVESAGLAMSMPDWEKRRRIGENQAYLEAVGQS